MLSLTHIPCPPPPCLPAPQSRRSMLSPEKLSRVADASVRSGARTWHLLPDEAVQQKIREAEERRRAMSVKMAGDQYDLEKK